jgi:hypothetical protein
MSSPVTLDLEPLPGPLTHFTVSRHAGTYQFVHRVTGERVSVPERTASDLFAHGDLTPVEVFETLLRPIICQECAQALLAGEEGLCVPCEAAQAMALCRYLAKLR